MTTDDLLDIHATLAQYLKMEGKRKEFSPKALIYSNTKRLATVKIENSNSENENIDTIVVEDDDDEETNSKMSNFRKRLDFESIKVLTDDDSDHDFEGKVHTFWEAKCERRRCETLLAVRGNYIPGKF